MMGGDSLLFSWGSEEQKTECCEWVGIRCANKSGHVIRLDLSPSALGISDYLWALRGKISPSLLDLKYLKYLDLSFINFTGSQIPSSIGTLRKLRYLNLSYTYVSGEIPSQLANLSNLQSLDLGYNFRLWAKNLEWLSHLSSLKDLVLSHSNLSKADDWLQIVSNFPHLTNLQLAVCKLPDVVIPPSLSLTNSSKSLAFLDLCCNSFSVSLYQWLFNFRGSLVYLELSRNRLGNSIPEAFGDMSSLAYLDLGQNQLEGSIPEAFGNLTSLEFLDLSNNSLQGEIPRSIWNLPMLSFFSVELNNLTGELPESIGKLSQLEVLRVSGNSLRGVVSEAHFANLSNLSDLGLSSNSLILNLSSDWIPPFRLDVILLRSCKMGPRFPNWLQTQKNYSKLDISRAGISDSIPNWFWGLSTELLYMNISNNNISGNVPNFSSLEFTNANEIDLSSNQFEGLIPVFLFKVSALHLSGNRFSELNSMCDVTNDVILTFLDISYNQFSGELPDCWSHFKQLRVLTLGNNELSGRIPVSIGSLTLIDTLNLANNSFVGELPASLKNCTELVVFDASENKLSGQVPAWIGKSLPYLVILSLRSNRFNGNLPSNVCDLPSLQVLDLSLNNVSGSLPNCLNLLAAIKRSWSPDRTVSHTYVSYPLSPRTFYFRIYDDRVQLYWKGKLSEFINNLGLLKSIDLSSNKFTGEIPREITELVGLVSLNLSRNHFSGQIPSEIGRLNLLDYLDLSNNRLSGRIPSSLTEVSRLTTLDLSNNNLSGKIPTSTQLQSFDAAAFMGNLDLCGDPLPKKCPGEEPTVPGTIEEASDQGDQEEGFVSQGFYVSLGLGFVIGFWGVFGTLLFKKSWRFAYFNFLDDVKDWIYVMAAVHKARLLALIQG
ncbi:hypothetical protein TIFTF001_041393 [Ficus carica]|uniref:Disease resistance R13L4/SHOC-2-like LRR domain-containing protein n=1 Tax=Ficus carica TaxID=3494 RepID=A0AA87ZNY2_FICCA|nr:hypothetical protein TIFTF001_041393 [Ficus carica]